MFIDSANASTGASSTIANYIPLIFVCFIFYFLIIRPEKKKQKEHEKFISNLKKNTKIITNFGLVGIIKSIDEKYVTLEIAKNVEIEILKNTIKKEI